MRTAVVYGRRKLAQHTTDHRTLSATFRAAWSKCRLSSRSDRQLADSVCELDRLIGDVTVYPTNWIDAEPAPFLDWQALPWRTP